MNLEWNLWQRGELIRRVEGIRPLLASWEKSTHPAQVRLGCYLDEVACALRPLPESGPLFVHLDVDVEDAHRLLHHYDLENYLTPLFGARCLPASRFALVSARKTVGGGSRILCGIAAPTKQMDCPGWTHFAMNARSGYTRPEWKQRIYDGLRATGLPPAPPGPAGVRMAWRCAGQRNWVALWKPTGDAMGPVLGLADGARPFNPNDDRIVDLELHLNVDDSLGHDVHVGLWWRSL